ncbi:MAG: BON domain-containing protein [Acidobacteriota bacterium]
MSRTHRVLVSALVGLWAVASLSAQVSREDQRTIDAIRETLLRLPYYGVFDFLVVRYEKGTVTVSGFAYRPTLKDDVGMALKRVPRVDTVVDNIEVLPTSQNDDRIRWSTYYAIYTDAALSRYAPGGGLTAFDLRFDLPRYPGMQPLGNYPIHIIVKGGRTQLLGVVNSEGDKTLAGFRAREVPGTFGVENDLMIVK